MTIEESISKLKINLIRRRPFYGVILMKLNELRESDAYQKTKKKANQSWLRFRHNDGG